MVGSPSSSSSSKRKLKPKTREIRKNQINVIDHISDDTMFEIFNHLSLKQNFQLKLLSKKWYSRLSSPNFINRTLNVCTFFYRLRAVRRRRPRPFPIVFSLHSDSSDHFISDQQHIHQGFSFEFLPKSMRTQLCLLGSSCGLVLCRCSHPVINEYQFFICNPLTRKWVWLPDCDDSVSDDDSHVLVCESPSTSNSTPTAYKVVRLPEIRISTKKFYVRIFSSDTGKWKNYKVLCSDKITMLYDHNRKVVGDQNGCLYWIIEGNKIMVYDLKSNVGGCGECYLIDLPKNEEEDDHNSVTATRSCLTESEGFIFYLRIDGRQMKFSVWLLEMEKDESSEQWSWKLVHNLELIKMLAGYDWDNTRITHMKPLGFSPMDTCLVFLQSEKYILMCNISTGRSELLSLSSQFHGRLSSYRFEVLPFLSTTMPTTIPGLREDSSGSHKV